MDIHESRGWKNRRRLADMKAGDWNDAERLAVRAERQRMYYEAHAAGLAAQAEADAALEAAQCRCTACGGTGKLTVAKAAGVVMAMDAHGFQGYQPSKAMIAALDAIARGIEVPAALPVIRFAYGAISPAPAVAVASVAPAPVMVEPDAKPSKSSKRDTFLEDGALIEV